MYLIGLTGGIGSGKSTVSRIFKEDFGCPIVDADLIAREILEPNKKAYKAIVTEFGPSILLGNGKVDREKLAELIFSNREQRMKLNAITHKEISKTMFMQVMKHFLKGERFVVLDVPLLLESKNKVLLNCLKYIVVVSCSQQAQLDRLHLRNGYSESESLKRINSQMSLSEKIKYATHTIDNNGAIANTNKQIEELYTFFRNSKSLTLYEYFFFLLCFLVIVSVLVRVF